MNSEPFGTLAALALSANAYRNVLNHCDVTSSTLQRSRHSQSALLFIHLDGPICRLQDKLPLSHPACSYTITDICQLHVGTPWARRTRHHQGAKVCGVTLCVHCQCLSAHKAFCHHPGPQTSSRCSLCPTHNHNRLFCMRMRQRLTTDSCRAMF